MSDEMIDFVLRLVAFVAVLAATATIGIYDHPYLAGVVLIVGIIAIAGGNKGRE